MARGQRLAARFEGLLSKLGTSFGEGQLDATLHRDGGRTGPSYTLRSCQQPIMRASSCGGSSRLRNALAGWWKTATHDSRSALRRWT